MLWSTTDATPRGMDCYQTEMGGQYLEGEHSFGHEDITIKIMCVWYMCISYNINVVSSLPPDRSYVHTRRKGVVF